LKKEFEKEKPQIPENGKNKLIKQTKKEGE
jgi:hypothetical protein